MPKPRIKTLLIVFAAIPLMLIAGILTAAMFTGGSAGGTLSTGRSVVTYSDSISLSSRFSSDTATIETAGRTIVVEPRRLIVDGGPVASINKDVSDIEVHVKHGAIKFIADGKPVPITLRYTVR